MTDKYAMQHWVEYGSPDFGNSLVIACDASMGRIAVTSERYPGGLLPIAGAIVDMDAHWWAWRAEVAEQHAWIATAWGEALTLFLALDYCRPGALVLADHQGAIDLANEALRGREARWRRVESVFGRLPAVRRAPTRVQHYNGRSLHRRADKISRAVRIGGAEAALIATCQAYARGGHRDQQMPKLTEEQ